MPLDAHTGSGTLSSSTGCNHNISFVIRRAPVGRHPTHWRSAFEVTGCSSVPLYQVANTERFQRSLAPQCRHRLPQTNLRSRRRFHRLEPSPESTLQTFDWQSNRIQSNRIQNHKSSHSATVSFLHSCNLRQYMSAPCLISRACRGMLSLSPSIFLVLLYICIWFGNISPVACWITYTPKAARTGSRLVSNERQRAKLSCGCLPSTSDQKVSRLMTPGLYTFGKPSQRASVGSYVDRHWRHSHNRHPRMMLLAALQRA